MTDRITGAILAVTAIAYGLDARTFTTDFITDPLGPQAWPYMLAGIMLLLSVYLIVRPEAEPRWPKRVVLRRQLFVVATLVGYGLLLEFVGFVTATVLAVGVLSLLLGANWWRSLVTGAAASAALFVLFSIVLGLPLPAGSLFGGR